MRAAAHYIFSIAVLGLATLAETRDKETGAHILRRQRYVKALADVYDALISKRVYKAAFAHTQAREIIINGRGSHFDPGVVDAFIEVENIFMDIAREYADSPAEKVAT